MEAITSRLEAILVGLRMHPSAEFGIEYHGEIGPQILGRPTCHALKISQLECPTSTLISQHGIDIPVTHHHGTALQRRPDDREDVLGLVGRIQQCLSARRHLPGCRIQNNPADHRSDGRVAGLEGPQHILTCLGQPRAESVYLGCLADTVAALENDKHSASRGHAPSFFLVLAQASANSRRAWRIFRVSRSKSRPAAKACSGRRLATRSYVASSR